MKDIKLIKNIISHRSLVCCKFGIQRSRDRFILLYEYLANLNFKSPNVSAPLISPSPKLSLAHTNLLNSICEGSLLFRCAPSKVSVFIPQFFLNNSEGKYLLANLVYKLSIQRWHLRLHMNGLRTLEHLGRETTIIFREI